MPKWKKDATEFEVGVSYNEVRGAQSSIPKPIWEILGHPEKIRFIVKGKHIALEAGEAKDHT